MRSPVAFATFAYSELVRSVQKRGVRGTLVALVGKARDRWVAGGRYGRDLVFDVRHGVQTRGMDWAPDAADPRGDRTRYETASPRTFRRLIRATAVVPEERVFVDLGCGKGRTLLLAAELPFKRVVGVEISGRLAAVARSNADHWSRGRPKSPPIDVVESDAALYELPLEPLLLYLFNPFGPETLKPVIDRLVRSLQASPRAVDVIYHGGDYPEVFDQEPTFRRLATGSNHIVYAAQPGMPVRRAAS
jgi:SAM-dependent methyltransferase